ncbi:hypothetical protein DFH08DRAFT_987506 [Mycena albidolilacea]|uniref:Uncharacterized protein n=1 Tax=Mycena albidolilacea TaxID=1033008 RepID=A0AAD7AA74_9AGAR|nr:hypothetical protein DFH08DRAFT_987506 [Mycena albidolilacea]
MLSVPASKNLSDTEVVDSEPVRHARERAADVHGYRHILSVLVLRQALIGAYIADAHLGRYNTITVAVFIVLIRHIILIVSAVPGVIEKSQTTLDRHGLRFGTGLFKAKISPLVAEQYRRTKLFVVETKSGERIIVDPTLTVSHVYLYFHLFINIGALVGQITMYIGFWPPSRWTISVSSATTKKMCSSLVVSFSSPRVAATVGTSQCSRHKLNYFKANRNTADHSSGSAATLIQLVDVPLLIMSII